MMTESSDSLELKILEPSGKKIVLRIKKRWDSCYCMLTVLVIILLALSVLFIALYIVEKKKSSTSERENGVVGRKNSLCLSPSCIGVVYGELNNT